MSSRRKLKNEINHLTYELLSECFSYKEFHPGKNTKKVDNVIKEIVKFRNELIARVNHPNIDTAKETKKHYNKIKKDIVHKFITLLDSLE